MIESPEEYEVAVDFANSQIRGLSEVSNVLYRELGTNLFTLCRLRGKSLFSTSISTNMEFGQGWFRGGRIMPFPPADGFYLLSQIKHLFEENIEDHVRELYGVDNLLFYVEHRNGYTDMYCVASEPNRPYILNNYINRGAAVIKQFIPVFREKFKKNIDEGEEIQFLYIQDDVAFDNPLTQSDSGRLQTEQNNSAKNLQQFEQDLYLLPNRIRDAIQLAAYGNTAKEIAALLNIKEKTVFGYFDTAKTRLRVHTLPELFDKLLAVTS